MTIIVIMFFVILITLIILLISSRYQKFLPYNSLFDKIYYKSTGKKFLFDRRLFSKCKHNSLAYYIRIDYRSGPGSFADNFCGIACEKCGYIMEENKVL